MDKIELNEYLRINILPYVKEEKLDDFDKIVFEVCKNIKYEDEIDDKPNTNIEAINYFLKSKQIEGCSYRTIKYYKYIIDNFFKKEIKLYYLITTENIRQYLSSKKEDKTSQVSIDNTRRVLSSFFSFLENENYIYKSPLRRIKKIKTIRKIKEVYTDEMIEKIKKETKNIRDLTIICFLLSTGVRVAELVNLNIDNVDFINKECIVLGKGNKERKVYFDIVTKLYLEEYLKSRKDYNEALFVSLLSPHKRLQISGIEIMLRKIGNKLNIRVHPHKFRRTLATRAIDKGMPIEQVKHLLGHTKIDTTLEYAIVDDNNVKTSHKKYLE